MRTVTVIIPTHNRQELLQQTIESVFAQQGFNGALEVIVSADCCTDGTLGALAELRAARPELQMVTSRAPGPSAARNAALRVAQGDIVAFVDDDVVCEPGWLKAIVAAFEDAKVGAVEGAIRLPQGRHSMFAARIENRGDGTFMAANAAYRRDLLLAVGGYDERFRLGREDSDLAWRVLSGGHTPRFVPDAAVTHDASHQARLFVKYARRAAGDVLLWRRHRKRFREAGFHVIPRSYWLNAMATLSIVGGMALRLRGVVSAGAGAMAVFLVYAVGRRAWGRKITPCSALRVAGQFVWIPWLHFWCAARSFWLTRNIEPWT